MVVVGGVSSKLMARKGDGLMVLQWLGRKVRCGGQLGNMSLAFGIDELVHMGLFGLLRGWMVESVLRVEGG